MVVFTSICANYLHKARVLARSVKKYIPDAVFIVCMTERGLTDSMRDDAFDSVVLSKDMWEGDFDAYIFKHAIVEASTAVKGQFFRWLYRAYPAEQRFVYLDPDCRVYSDFSELRELLVTKPIVVCPHLVDRGNVQMEISSMAHGVYNLGFLAVNRSKEARAMIEWWAQRLSQYCYDDIPHGIFTDQKWIDLAPCFFDVYILKHHGYDFATWRMMDAGLAKEGGVWTVKGQPLRFVHFSGYGATIEHCMQEWAPDDLFLKELYGAYREEHEAANADHVSQTPWSYGCYASGEAVRTDIRQAWREHKDEMAAFGNPFQYSNLFFNLRLRVYPVTIRERSSILWNGCRRALRAGGVGGLMRKARQKLLRK